LSLTPRITASIKSPHDEPRDPALIRNRFMKGLGTGRGGALEA